MSNEIRSSAQAAGSPQEIEALVQKRVQERDSWLVDGQAGQMHPSTTEMLEFMGRILPKYLTFSPLSQEELDVVFPVLPMDWERIKTPATDEIRLTWLGHASLLVQMGGVNMLMDPVFSDRCSPSQWFGPKRYRQPPCSMADLCQNLSIDLVAISHNHYDHLDYNTLKELLKHTGSVPFVVPLGLREWFHSHLARDLPVYELDWHETAEIGPISLTSVPMRHWSNRIGDRDKTLWCGYAIRAGDDRFLFPGDTAWFDDLTSIGEDYGPFNVAAIPIGAYEPRDFMKYNHINVEEAVRMKDAIRATSAVPIHWGTFPLTTEPVMEPREKLLELMNGRKDAESFVAWQIGETKSF